jgi:hypothetical protein
MGSFNGEKSAVIAEMVGVRSVCGRFRTELQPVIEATLDSSRARSQVSDMMRQRHVGLIIVGGLMPDFEF